LKLIDALSKFLLISILLCSDFAFARNYEFIVENPEAKFYVDKSSTIRSSGNIDIWVLIDYTLGKVNKKGEKYFSMENHLLLDCRNFTQTMKYMKVYMGHMASGDVLASGSTNDRRPVSRGSTMELILDQLCR
jgi:hypothetical protein